MASHAKITAPDARGLLARPRLFKRISQSAAQPITWIASPPGAGKTSLAASLLWIEKPRHLWYQLDAGDGDPATLFAYLAQAVQSATRRKRIALPVFGPEYGSSLLVFARRFFEALYALLPPGGLLVFDDYHELPWDSATHEVLREGFSVLPPRMRVMVLSRQLPPPTFARLQANGSLCLLEWDELRMTRQEAEAIVRARLPRATDRTFVSELFELTGGWPAGLVLLTSNHRKGGVPPRFAEEGQNDLLFNYFASEVVDGLDAGLREVLLATAVLPRCTAEQANQLCGLPEAGARLRAFARSGCFTVRHGHRDPAYEFHPLFRAFLLQRGREAFSPATRADLHGKAARILEDHGEIEGAVALLQESGSWALLEALILRCAPAMMRQGRTGTLSDWLASLPEGLVDGNGWLLYWRGACHLGSDPLRGRALLESSFACFAGQGEWGGRFLAWSGIVDSILYAWDDFHPLDRWIDWFDENAGELRRFEGGAIEASVTTSLIGALVQRRPDHPRIGHWIKAALRVLHGGQEARVRVQAAAYVVAHSFWTGDFALIESVAQQQKRIAQAPDASPLSVLNWQLTELCSLCSFQDVSSRVRMESVEASLEYSRRTGVHLLDFMIHAQAVIASALDGRVAETQAFLGRMAISMHGRNSRAFHHYLSSWVARLGGDLPKAMMHAEQAVDLGMESGMAFSIALVRHGRAELLFDSGRREEAVRELAEVQRLAESLKSDYFLFLCHLTESRFALDSGERFLPPLQKAMEIGRRRGFLNSYWWVPAEMSKLFGRASEAGIETDYVHSVIRTRRLLPPDAAHSCDEWPWEIRVRTLGAFEIIKNGGLLESRGKTPRKALMLLKAIVAAGRMGARETVLADQLWPEAEGDAALQSLATCLHRLRQFLDVEGAVLMKDGRLSMNPLLCWVDAHAFERLVGSSDREGRVLEGTTLEKAIRLYSGPFLEHHDDAWAQGYRERLRALHLRTIVHVGLGHEERERFSEAIAWYERGLGADPTAESLFQRILICLRRSGRSSEGAQVFRRCAAALKAGHGLEPAPETRKLAESLRG